MDRCLQQFDKEDALDDEFFTSLSPDGKHLVTGGYNKTAHVVDTNATMNTGIECNFMTGSGVKAGQTKNYNKNKRIIGVGNYSELLKNDLPSAFKNSANKIDSSKQVTLGSWAPQNASSDNHTLALGYRNCIFIYEGSTRLTSGKAMSSLSKLPAKLF